MRWGDIVISHSTREAEDETTHEVILEQESEVINITCIDKRMAVDLYDILVNAITARAITVLSAQGERR